MKNLLEYVQQPLLTEQLIQAGMTELSNFYEELVVEFNPDTHFNYLDTDPNSDANTDLDKQDLALKQYVISQGYSFEVESNFDELMSRYPVTEKLNIYRGILFDDKESYDKFIKSYDGTSIKLNGISSWSKNIRIAKTFAVTKPVSDMAFMDQSSMSSISKQSKQGERLAGYRGIIMATKIDKNNKAIDVGKSKYDKESEVILAPGTIQVDRIVEIKSFKDILDQDITADDFILTMKKKDLTRESDVRSLYQYILKHKIELSDEARHHLYTLFKPARLPKKLVNYKTKMQTADDFETDEFHLTIHLGSGDLYKFLTNRHIYNAKDLKTVDKLKARIVRDAKAMQKQILSDKKVTDSDIAKIDNHLDAFYDYIPELKKIMSEISGALFGKKYQKKTGMDATRKINQLKGQDQKDAIDAYMNDIKSLIQNINNL